MRTANFILLVGMTIMLLGCGLFEGGQKATDSESAVSVILPVESETPSGTVVPPAVSETPLLNGPGKSTQVSAAEACNLMDTPHDTLATASAPGEEWGWEIRDSGPDRHIAATITDPEGVLLGKYESIIKDRTKYYRESTPSNAEVYGEWLVVGTDLHRSFSLPCLDPSGFEEGTSGSSDEPDYTSERFLSEEEGDTRDEYWADSTGRPTRARRTIFPPEYDGISNTETGVMEFTYSGYGEPNVITAPCANAAPDQSDNPGLMRDCINLLALKDTLRGSASLNWSVDTAITLWDGVTVADAPKRVTMLGLNGHSLTGTIPATLNRLTGLLDLLLSDNLLTGPIPTELGDLPSLETLCLSENSLTGCIPVALENVATNDLSSLNLLYCQPPAPDGLAGNHLFESAIWNTLYEFQKAGVRNGVSRLQHQGLSSDQGAP